MITNISSSKDCIIKQEIYSQMMVYNIMQSITNDLENDMKQENYKLLVRRKNFRRISPYPKSNRYVLFNYIDFLLFIGCLFL